MSGRTASRHALAALPTVKPAASTPIEVRPLYRPAAGEDDGRPLLAQVAEVELRQEIHEGLHLLQSALAHVNTLLM